MTKLMSYERVADFDSPDGNWLRLAPLILSTLFASRLFLGSSVWSVELFHASMSTKLFDC